MGYTIPTTRAYLYKVTASDWNTDIVDNIIYLKAQSIISRPQILSTLAVSAYNASTTVQTALWTYNLAGGTLGATGILRVMFAGRAVNGGGSSHLLELYYWYGANSTLLWSFTLNAGQTIFFNATMYMRGNSATNSQKILGNMTTDELSCMVTPWSAGLATDSTAAQDMIIKGLNDVSAAGVYTQLDLLTCEFMS